MECDLTWKRAEEENYEGVHFLRMLMGSSLKEALTKSAINDYWQFYFC